MKTIRITISSVDIVRNTEPEFQKELTERLISAGFNLKDNIIRQERNDVSAVDFIQLRYNVLDRFDVQLNTFFFKIYRWLRINFLK